VMALCEHSAVGELLIVTGPPGAGKSTISARLVERRAPSVLIEGDAFFRFLRRGRIEPWLVESHRQNEAVTDSAGAAAGRFVGAGYWTVFDGVIGPWFLPRFVAGTGLHRVHYVVLLPSVEACVERVATRVGHGFTDEAETRHMHREFVRATRGSPCVLDASTDDVEHVVGSIMSLVESDQVSFGT
jgi:predicted kinase